MPCVCVVWLGCRMVISVPESRNSFIFEGASVPKYGVRKGMYVGFHEDEGSGKELAK